MAWRERIEGIESRKATSILLGVAVLAAAALLISLDSKLTFIADDWGMLLRRQSWSVGTFLEPYAEHLILGPLLVFKPLQEVFGMGSALPYYLVSIALYLLSAVLLFHFLRPRVGDWPALFGAVLVLFLGAAFENLLWISPLNFSGSMSAGLGMLLALDRDDDKGDRIACALLALSLVFSSVGIAFAAGAAIEVALGRRQRLRRAYLVAIPVAAYGLWWIVWKNSGEGHVSADNLQQLPEFLFNVTSAGFASLLGIADESGGPEDPPLLGRLLVVATVAAVVVRIVRERRLPRGLAVALVIGISFWSLIGIDLAPGRYPNSSRYQYMSAIFLLLILAEALRGARIAPPLLLLGAAVTAFAVSGGVSQLRDEYEGSWRPFAESTKASLAAVEIAGDNADPDYQVDFPPTLSVDARTYLDAARRFGSPAYDEAQLATVSESDRASADLTMANAMGFSLVPPDPAEEVYACESLEATPEGETGITLLRGGFTFANRSGGEVEIELRRFADEFSVFFGGLGPGGKTSLTIPADGAERPWVLGLKGDGPVRLCTTSS